MIFQDTIGIASDGRNIPGEYLLQKYSIEILKFVGTAQALNTLTKWTAGSNLVARVKKLFIDLNDEDKESNVLEAVPKLAVKLGFESLHLNIDGTVVLADFLEKSDSIYLNYKKIEILLGSGNRIPLDMDAHMRLLQSCYSLLVKKVPIKNSIRVDFPHLPWVTAPIYMDLFKDICKVKFFFYIPRGYFFDLP